MCYVCYIICTYKIKLCAYSKFRNDIYVYLPGKEKKTKYRIKIFTKDWIKYIVNISGKIDILL